MITLTYHYSSIADATEQAMFYNDYDRVLLITSIRNIYLHDDELEFMEKDHDQSDQNSQFHQVIRRLREFFSHYKDEIPCPTCQQIVKPRKRHRE